jgi:hypothetical protein
MKQLMIHYTLHIWAKNVDPNCIGDIMIKVINRNKIEIKWIFIKCMALDLTEVGWKLKGKKKEDVCF